jgi:hypothetical protein
MSPNRKALAAKRAEYLRIAHAAFPTDPVVLASLAGTEADLGNHDRALHLLAEVSNASDTNILGGSIGRQQAMRDLITRGGLDDSTAWPLAALKEQQTMFAISAIASPLIESIKNTGNLDIDSRIEIASRAVALARVLNPFGDTSEMNAVVALALEKQALQGLPPTIEFGDTGMTVENRLREIASARERGDYLRSTVQPRILSAKATILKEFLERREEFGTPAAVEWFAQRTHQRK